LQVEAAGLQDVVTQLRQETESSRAAATAEGIRWHREEEERLEKKSERAEEARGSAPLSRGECRN
jgi:hypothetical protein